MRRAVVVLMMVGIFGPEVAWGEEPGQASTRTGADIEARVNAYLAPYVAGREFSGVVLIADEDRVLVRKAYGMANVALGVANTPGTKFGIASLTKTFTAAAIVILQERGRLRFDDRLDKFMPGYPRGDKITLDQLLRHSAGVPNPDTDKVAYQRLTPDQLIETFKQKPLDFEPGKGARYSNGGYVLLARVVEKASGQRFEDFLSDNVFAPLGMKETGTLDREKVIPRLASPYQPGPEPIGLENAIGEDPSVEFGCGSLYSTADDLYRWAKAVRSERLYKRTALKYPFGWGKRNQYGHRYIEQSGLIAGFMSHIIIYLDQPMTVVFLSNIQSGLFGRVEKDLTAIAFGGEAEKRPAAPEALPVEQRLLAAYCGQYQGPFFTLRIFEEEGHLYSRFNESPGRSFLVPVATDELFMRSNYARIRGKRNKLGLITELSIKWSDEGEPMKLPKSTSDR